MFNFSFIFLYATVSKIFELTKFYYQLAKSPLIPYGYNEYVGNSVLLIELIIVYLVLFFNIGKMNEIMVLTLRSMQNL